MRKLVFFLSFFVLTKFTIDPDLGWHLAMGQRFLTSGEIIRADDFSWTMTGFPWANSYFGYQVLVTFLFERIGFLATGILFGFLAAFGILLLLPKKITFVSVGVIAVGVLMMSGNIGIRPHVFDLVLMAILLRMCDAKLHFSLRAIPLWFLLFVVWANIHVGFMVGLLVFGAFSVGDYLFLSKKIFRKVKILALLISASVLGTFVNPFSYNIWKSALLESGGPTAWFYIIEFQPITISLPLTIFYIVSGLFLILMLKGKWNIKPTWLLVGTLLFILPLLSVYFAFFWATIFIFLGTRYLLNFQSPKFLKSKIIAFCAVCAILVIVLAFFANLLESYDFEKRLKHDGYPIEAIKFMKKEGIGPRLYNRYGWGGFLNLLMPETKVFIDGRMAGWRQDGRSILADYIAIDHGDCSLAKQYAIESVLVKVEDISCFSDFKIIYEDELSRVLIRQ